MISIFELIVVFKELLLFIQLCNSWYYSNFIFICLFLFIVCSKFNWQRWKMWNWPTKNIHWTMAVGHDLDNFFSYIFPRLHPMFAMIQGQTDIYDDTHIILIITYDDSVIFFHQFNQSITNWFGIVFAASQIKILCKLFVLTHYCGF